MSDEHVSPNLEPLWARQRNAFQIVFFWRAESGPILWEQVDQFLSLHAFIPQPQLWQGATGKRKVIGVSNTKAIWYISIFL